MDEHWCGYSIAPLGAVVLPLLSSFLSVCFMLKLSSHVLLYDYSANTIALHCVLISDLLFGLTGIFEFDYLKLMCYLSRNNIL